MILILDDTFNERHKYNDISFLKEEKYKNICKILVKPTKKDFREIVGILSNIKLLCNHRSLRLFNDKQEVIDGEKTIQNFFIQVQSESVNRIEFGRDMHSNLKAKTLDKDVFYSNLKKLLDHYIETNQIELKILFFGNDYAEIEYLNAIDKMMDEIAIENPDDFKNNKLILEGIRLIFKDKEPMEIIDEWINSINNGISKKEIIKTINQHL